MSSCRPLALVLSALVVALGLATLPGPAAATERLGASERHPDGRGIPARSDLPAEGRIIPYASNLPGCADPAVISTVTSAFGWREWQYWNSALSIAAVDRVHEIGNRTWGYNFIPRRYCSARVLLSDNRFARVDYAVRDRQGLFMLTWDVDWCVTGLDRHKSYAPECRMARP